MAVRTADAVWEGELQGGKGRMKVGSGAFEVPYSFTTRFAEEPGTNPEELIGAAHAGCFSMALSGALTRAGTPPTKIETTARVHLEKVDEKMTITRIELQTTGQVPGIDQAAFERAAQDTKVGCPVSRLLTGAEISVEAKLS